MFGAQRNEIQSLIVVMLVAGIMLVAFVFLDWRSLADDPLPAFLNDQVRENDGGVLSAFVRSANSAVDLLITIQFGLFVLVGVAVKDSFSEVVSAGWVKVSFVSGFFFFSFLSTYYAYLGYQAVLIQVGNKTIFVERVDAILSLQAIFLAVAALFTFALTGVSLLRFSNEKQRSMENKN